VLSERFTTVIRQRSQFNVSVKPGLPPWGPHVRATADIGREGSPLVKLRNPA